MTIRRARAPRSLIRRSSTPSPAIELLDAESVDVVVDLEAEALADAHAEVDVEIVEVVIECEPESDRRPERRRDAAIVGPRTPWARDRPQRAVHAGEAARQLGVTPNTVTRWSRAGKISAIQTMGGHRRFRRSEIERVMLEANLIAAKPA